MKLYLINHDCKYAVEQILLTMFPGEKPQYPSELSDGDKVISSLFRGTQFATASCELHYMGASYKSTARIKTLGIEDGYRLSSALGHIIKLSFYRASVEALGKKPVWGALTGIRPGKILSDYIESGMSERAALTKFRKIYDVSPERANLCLDTARYSLMEKQGLQNRDICLYVGIPFCPTRCAYCSFVSQSVEKSISQIPAFLDALKLEIHATAKTVRALRLRPVSLYIGGGTPTTLSAQQLEAMLGELDSAFDLSSLREYTVEAGRPETITEEKLRVLKNYGVSRLSVNPQTMSDEVLNNIGRRHTAADIYKALEMVRQQGDFAVNMDLIAGLPGDSPSGFKKTLDAVLSLSPENITIHTLALKKGSKILTSGIAVPSGAEVGEMLDFSRERLRDREYAPYYLYRQKYTSGGFENIGWCKKDYQSLYNICIMEEHCSIISMGGGASTKLVSGDGRIERIFAPKYSKEYIEGINKVTAEKEKIEVFYRGIRSKGD